MSKETHDPVLRDLAMIFNTFDPFPDEDGHMAEWRADLTAKTCKHFSALPGGRVIGVRFYLKGRNRIIAYGTMKQEVDLLRFADMVTVRFWKYGYRNRHRGVSDEDMNFSVQNAVQDLTDFETDRPEIIQLIDEVEKHFLNIDVLSDPDIPGTGVSQNPRKSKTARGEFMACHRLQMHAAETRHQELLDALGAIVERLEALETNRAPVFTPAGNVSNSSTDLTEAQRKEISLLTPEEPFPALKANVDPAAPNSDESVGFIPGRHVIPILYLRKVEEAPPEPPPDWLPVEKDK